MARISVVLVSLLLFGACGWVVFGLGMTRAANSLELWASVLGVLGLGGCVSWIGGWVGVHVAWIIGAGCVPIWLLTLTLGMLQPPFVVLAIGLPIVMWLIFTSKVSSSAG